jgi:hypothetical protein
MPLSKKPGVVRKAAPAAKAPASTKKAAPAVKALASAKKAAPVCRKEARRTAQKNGPDEGCAADYRHAQAVRSRIGREP